MVRKTKSQRRITMNKKVFAIVLIVCLAFGVAFAAKSTGVRIGAQAGYSGYSLQFTDKDSSDSYVRLSNGGFYFAGTAEFALSQELSVKAEAGINLMEKTHAVFVVGGRTLIDRYTNENAPMHFAFYVGPQYCIEISKTFCIDLGAGFDVLMGKISKDDEDENTFNAAMGVGVEAAAAFHVADNVKLSLGGKFAWHFINTNKDLDDIIHDLGDAMYTTNLAFQAYAGCTYAF